MALLGPNLVTKTLSYFDGPGPGAPAIVVTVSAAAAGPASVSREDQPGQSGSHGGATYHGGVAVLIASDLSQGHGRRALAARRLVQARAPRAHDHRRAQRRGQDDPAADAVRRDLRSTAASSCSPRARASPSTTSARRASATSACGNTFSRARREPLELEAELQRLEHAMADGDEQAMNRYAGVQARFEAVGGYGWRERARSVVHGLGFVDDDLDRAAENVLRRPAHARLAGPRARRPARPAAARRAHQPPRHRVARVARADAARPRRGHRPRRPRPLVPGDGRHLGARARGRPRALLQRHLARVAPRAGRARAGARPGDREAAGRDRAHGALRRALPLQGDQGAPGPGPPQEAQQDRAHRARPARRPRRSSSRSRSPSARGASSSSSRTPACRLAPIRRASCSPTPSCGSSAASTSRSWGPTARARRPSSRRSSGERQLDGGRLRSGHNVKVGYLSQHAEELEGGGARTVLEAAVEAHRPAAQPGPRAARALPLQRRGGRQAARRAQRRRAPAPVAGHPRPVRAPTC